ncbi:MAG: UDP binding domain-containing protein, partial [Paracoccaceae bacterium]
SWRARDVGSATPIIDLARTNNDNAPDMLAGRVAVELAKHGGKPVKDARVLILGVSYKRNIEDTRESPALAMLHRLEQMGAKVDYHDPYFPVMPVTRDHPDLAGRKSAELSEERVARYDAVVLTTDHSNVDYALVGRVARLILDTRNVFDGSQAAPLVKI